jgi:hypothetical protein
VGPRCRDDFNNNFGKKVGKNPLGIIFGKFAETILRIHCIEEYYLGKSMFGNNSTNYFAEWLVAKIFGATSEKQQFLGFNSFLTTIFEKLFLFSKNKTIGLFRKEFFGVILKAIEGYFGTLISGKILDGNNTWK